MKNKNNILSPTELMHKSAVHIDKVSLMQAMEVMLIDHNYAIEVVKKNMENIKNVVEKIVVKLSLKNNSKLIFAGAGTSARIAIQDGAELYPTFGWPRDRLAFIIAGGISSILFSKENAEDDKDKPYTFLKDANVTENDVLIALAASGNTAFTSSVIKFARSMGVFTISISNNPYGEINTLSNMNITLNTGPEILQGSTRLKAGTAQKVCLNLISTLVMSKLGKVKNGQMIEMIASNKKLRERKIRMIKNL